MQKKTINKCITLTQDWNFDFDHCHRNLIPRHFSKIFHNHRDQQKEKIERNCHGTSIKLYINVSHLRDGMKQRQHVSKPTGNPTRVRTRVNLKRLPFLKGTDATVTKRHHYVPFSKFTCTDEIRRSSVPFCPCYRQTKRLLRKIPLL